MMYRIHLNPAYCKGCGICIEACPKNVLKSGRRIDAKGHLLPQTGDMERCSGCRTCELGCPDFAIALSEDAPTKEGKE